MLGGAIAGTGLALAGLTAASFIVGCTALAVATVAGFAATGAALGSILSPYALQGYLAGGVSKSSFNNIHWDEKSARLGGCYGAAITFGGLLASGPYMGYAGLVEIYAIVPKIVQYASYISTAYSLIKGDWKSVGADIASYALNAVFEKEIPIGLGIKYAEGVSKFCKENQ
ncbi:hypothetical protein AR546_07135 [Leptospira interrogans serovar Canicola]|uniref:Uncharacterized protein n=3 Tax=Leptospira interrogans TaxID=173 RepID=A0A067YC84_LEPIR|nr:hypothetical protein [Leptospira interrogans]AGZ84992.1 hypothetical protein [Leptospira interrogans serovar Canicola]EKO68788.1 hypothetical protein LEP1GSC069_1537 [Leptospira interrogans serovar Canicola str. Fiocruz LV133]OLZ32058.1 hypothetical protein AR546_07135 [Leptospira interrogans serovar Canicola]OQM30113.1 hypothetical protein DV30_12595 [Leptospira interrogans serovar Canicola str. Gui44]POR17316.1 hypothetical protein B0T34_15765 [Leptospira interrogans serovar Canicola]